MADGGWYAAPVAVKRFAGIELKKRVRDFAEQEIRQRLEELRTGDPRYLTGDQFFSKRTLEGYTEFLSPIEPRNARLEALLDALDALEGSGEEALLAGVLQRFAACPCGASKHPEAGWVKALRWELACSLSKGTEPLTHFVMEMSRMKHGQLWSGSPPDRDLALLAIVCGYRHPSWNRALTCSEAVNAVTNRIRQIRKETLRDPGPPGRRGRPRK